MGTQVAKGPTIMKDNSFTMAMNKIVGEHQAEVQREIRHQKRRVIMERARKGLAFVAILGLLAAAFCYRHQIETSIKTKFFHSDVTTESGANPVAKASVALDTARKNAATRDKLINELSKSK